MTKPGVLYRATTKIGRICTNARWRSLEKAFKQAGSGSFVDKVPRVTGASSISLGDNVFFGSDVRLEAWAHYGDADFSPSITIGSNVVLTDRVYISCIDSVEIGDGTLIGRDVFITDNSHGSVVAEEAEVKPVERPLSSRGPISIGPNVWIGRQVTILSGVSIGSGAIIGAHSLVNKDIPENSVAVGCPARVVKKI